MPNLIALTLTVYDNKGILYNQKGILYNQFVKSKK
jgi:hypothetical protein